MNKILLCLICAVALFAAVAPCLGDAVNGVLAEERVINLPQDSGKWYVSIVGSANDARYREVLSWFDTNASLKTLKNRTHFCPVASDTAIYKERYASNVKGLPTVRLQKPDGTIAYEASGKNLPMTAAGLYSAMASGVQSVEGCRPVLPWRREMEKRCPGPCPTPDPQPQPLDTPEPLIDEPVDTGIASYVVVMSILGCALIGAVIGLVVQWKKTYSAM